MGSEASDQMLALLQELAGLKEIDQTAVAQDPQQRMAHKERQRRRIEVRAQIKRLARSQKNEQS
jgi:hypothetical protein